MSVLDALTPDQCLSCTVLEDWQQRHDRCEADSADSTSFQPAEGSSTNLGTKIDRSRVSNLITCLH